MPHLPFEIESIANLIKIGLKRKVCVCAILDQIFARLILVHHRSMPQIMLFSNKNTHDYFNDQRDKEKMPVILCTGIEHAFERNLSSKTSFIRPMFTQQK